MYSDSQAFQQLAAQAMTASNVIQATQRLSEASECPSTGSRFAEEGYHPMPSSPPHKTTENSRKFQQDPSRCTSRFTDRSSLAAARGRDSNVSKQPLQHQFPDNHLLSQHTEQAAGAVTKHQSRATARRSDHAYAQRRSWVPASVILQGNRTSGHRTSQQGRQSVASTLTASWAGEDEVDALDWSTESAVGGEKNLFNHGGRSCCSAWRVCCLVFPVAFSLLMILGGVMFLVYGSDRMIDRFQIWRLCFFLAALPLIWYIGTGVTQAFVWMVEKSMFRMQNALYYAYAVRVRLYCFFRVFLIHIVLFV